MANSSEVGPNAAPSSTFVRRARLQRLGSTGPQSDSLPSDVPRMSENTPFNQSARSQPDSNYGTIPRSLLRHPSLQFSRKQIPPRLANLPEPPRSANNSQPSSPMFSPSLRNLSNLSFSRIGNQRPISAYDATFHSESKDDGDLGMNMDAKKNGVRVWYSSYSSIDWMHDAIKESLRFSRLRKKKSLKARIRLAFDRLLGWIIVTLVGFLTAVFAYLVVTGERWLFSLKDGYCTQDWTRAKELCCPQTNPMMIFPTSSREIECPEWRQWSELITWARGSSSVQFMTYTFIAIVLAVSSCWLTLLLTKSTSFVTRKESGVLGPDFQDGSEATAVHRKVFYYASGSGIPELKAILSGFVIHGYLGGRVLIAKSVGLALSVASGLQLGKEGPFVHIACCIGNIVSRLASKYENNEAKRREILSAACAAGVAVAFGAPIGGTLFSLEEVSYFFPAKVMWRSFFCAMIAAITLKLLNPFGTGKLVLFQVTYDKDWHAFELLPFVILGVFGGVYGAYFSKLNFRWSRDVRNATWLKNHPVVEVFLVTLATSAFCFLNPYTRMGGTELVSALFSECHKGVEDEWGLCLSDPGSWAQVTPIVCALLLALVVRGALTLVTFGIRLPAGIFIPSLAAGAMVGRVFGILLQFLRYRHPDLGFFSACSGDNCIIPGLYAMVGAAASLAGVTRTTVSLAVIMFELTDTLSYTIPIMIAVLCAKTTADALEEKGIYELVIDVAHLPYLDCKKPFLWGDRQIADVIVRDVDNIRLDQDNTVKTLRDKLQDFLQHDGNQDAGFPILRVDEHDEDSTRLVGVIGARELEHALFIVADHPDETVTFQTTYLHHPLASSSISSLLDDTNRSSFDMFDFSVYMDQAPLTITLNSPLELVQQFFVKLGARYVVVTDMDGYYEGIIDKKTWLAFLNEAGGD
ncbi:chloride channel [Lentinula aff. detonsa]|uniref:Chloride channel protein n=1 Tax=Lentinula aff. detonsa TaxID=2804958 RepID=A0AA38U102_9AGAR|nr:chloride channel [Lentinula aff. detonsa]